MREQVETFMNPTVALPITATAALSSFMDVLPTLMQVGGFIYTVLLIAHKLWQWRKEYKEKNAPSK